MTDPLGYSSGNTQANTTYYSYNTWDEMTDQYEPVPQSGMGPFAEPHTAFSYDLMGNNTAVTDPDGNTTEYTYNELNEVTSKSLSGGSDASQITDYTYDLDGNVLTITTPDGNTITDTYDDDDRLSGQTYQNSSGTTTQTLGFGYDADSRMTSAFSNVSSSANHSSTESYGYDDDGRLTGETTTYTGYVVVVALNQTFDNDGNRLTLAASIDGTADLKDTFGYNNLDELTSETQQGQSGGNAVAAEGVSFGYDPVGNVTTSGHFSDTSMSTSVFTTTNTYDHIERLTAVTNNSSSVSLTQSYGYNADGWVTSESNSTDGSRTYVYDDDGRETAVNKGSGSSFVNQAYTYDLAGNRLSATSGTTHVASIGVGLNNRISSDASGSYTYDLDGNQVNRSSGSTTLTYSYNAADQQTGASQTTSGSTNFAEAYWYDPTTGQRMGQSSTVAGTVTTDFYIDDPTTGNPLITLNSSGAVIERDLPGRSLGQTLAVDSGMTGSGAGTTSWLITDNVGSVTDVMNNSGAVIDHTRYDSFGNVTAQSNASGGTRFGFSGMITDSLTGENLDDLREEANGRFTTQDPTGFGGGDYNLYRYAGANPGTYNDPSGLQPPTWGVEATPYGPGVHENSRYAINNGQVYQMSNGSWVTTYYNSGETYYYANDGTQVGFNSSSASSHYVFRADGSIYEQSNFQTDSGNSPDGITIRDIRGPVGQTAAQQATASAVSAQLQCTQDDEAQTVSSAAQDAYDQTVYDRTTGVQLALAANYNSTLHHAAPKIFTKIYYQPEYVFDPETVQNSYQTGTEIIVVDEALIAAAGLRSAALGVAGTGGGISMLIPTVLEDGTVVQNVVTILPALGGATALAGSGAAGAAALGGRSALDDTVLNQTGGGNYSAARQLWDEDRDRIRAIKTQMRARGYSERDIGEWGREAADNAKCRLESRNPDLPRTLEPWHPDYRK
jgi:RHS repeat-associated protein